MTEHIADIEIKGNKLIAKFKKDVPMDKILEGSVLLKRIINKANKNNKKKTFW